MQISCLSFVCVCADKTPQGRLKVGAGAGAGGRSIAMRQARGGMVPQTALTGSDYACGAMRNARTPNGRGFYAFLLNRPTRRGVRSPCITRHLPSRTPWKPFEFQLDVPSMYSLHARQRNRQHKRSVFLLKCKTTQCESPSALRGRGWSRDSLERREPPR